MDESKEAVKSRMRLRVVMYDEDTQEQLAQIDLDPRLEARIIQEEVWSQTSWPESDGGAIADRLLMKDGSVAPTRTIWRYWSDEDVYLAGVCLASSAEEAQLRGFADLVENRPDDGRLPNSWRDYHEDHTTIRVEDLGAGGSRMRGDIEF